MELLVALAQAIEGLLAQAHQRPIGGMAALSQLDQLEGEGGLPLAQQRARTAHKGLRLATGEQVERQRPLRGRDRINTFAIGLLSG
jgi:hypothetical protein